MWQVLSYLHHSFLMSDINSIMGSGIINTATLTHSECWFYETTKCQLWPKINECRCKFFRNLQISSYIFFHSNQIQYILKTIICFHSGSAPWCLSGSGVGFNLAVLTHAFDGESEAASLIHRQMERSCLPATARCLCHSQLQISLRVALEAHTRQTDLMRDHSVYTVLRPGRRWSRRDATVDGGSYLAGLSWQIVLSTWI